MSGVTLKGSGKEHVHGGNRSVVQAVKPVCCLVLHGTVGSGDVRWTPSSVYTVHAAWTAED